MFVCPDPSKLAFNIPSQMGKKWCNLGHHVSLWTKDTKAWSQENTHGGRKNCSMSTYMPRIISVRRKYFPTLSNVLSFS